MSRYILLFILMAAFSVALAVTLGRYSQAADEATRIEIDPKTNAVRVIVDGREIATITGDGLHVQGDLSYTGRVTDVGGAAGASP